MKRKRTEFWARKFSFGRLVIYLILTLVFVAMFYPFFYVLSLSVMPYENFVKQAVHAWPNGFTLLYFQEVLKENGLVRGFQISVARTVVGTTLNVVTTVMAGYALSRRKLKYGRFLTFLFLIPMYFHGGMIPYFLTIRATGMLNTFWALILPGLVSSMWLFIARAYFLEFPEEIIESATIDGAGQFRIFWSIVWPTSAPLIATIAMMYGTDHWNEYFWSRVLVPSELWPATVRLYEIMHARVILQGLGVGVQLEEQSFIAAVAALLIIPMLVVYSLLQRYVVRGIMIGAIKG